MKRLLTYILPLVVLLCACNTDPSDRPNRSDDERITSIEEQLSAMSTTASQLESAIVLLQGYSASLTASANELRRAIDAANEKIKELEESADRNNKEIVNLINELNSLKSTTSERLSQLYASIETIEQTINRLDAELVAINLRIEQGFTDTHDWAKATFATLNQYSTLLAELSLVQTVANSTAQNFKEFQTSTTEHLALLDAQVAEFNEALYYAYTMIVRDLTNSYTEAIVTAGQSITKAYTEAIATAVSTSEDGLKAWVGEQFNKYYDIAQTEAKLAVLRTAITDGDTQLQSEIDALLASLAKAKEELTAAYERAIAEAIATNNGTIDTRIAEAISAAEAVTDARIDRVESYLEALAERIEALESALAKLLARVQSLTYIPIYSDGRATVDSSTKLLTLDFHVSPASCVATLAQMWDSAVSVKAVRTLSRAVTLTPLTVTAFEADAQQGIISLTVACDALGEQFFEQGEPASAALFISDGNNSIISDYIELVVQ